ncbi:MAG: hypothetical protein K9I82_12895 [Chitinophagaceae bacterium]|jgi:acyl carrier protein|nr:hypothetical protein [Chitinophagaceae bacterium]
MNLEKFIVEFESQFDELEKGSISKDTVFRDLDEWSSLVALCIIAFVDEEVNYKLTAKDFKDSTTVFDLYSKIKI